MFATLYETVSDDLKMMAQCLAATSALIAAVSEEMPQIVERYGQLLKDLEKNSPRAAHIREKCALLDAVAQRMRRAT
jgi:hypothetical protein